MRELGYTVPLSRETTDNVARRVDLGRDPIQIIIRKPCGEQPIYEGKERPRNRLDMVKVATSVYTFERPPRDHENRIVDACREIRILTNSSVGQFDSSAHRVSRRVMQRGYPKDGLLENARRGRVADTALGDDTERSVHKAFRLRPSAAALPAYLYSCPRDGPIRRARALRRQPPIQTNY